MMLEINVDVLKRNKITAHQFLILQLIYQQKYTLLDEYLSLSNSEDKLQEDLYYLNSIGFINQLSINPKDFQFIKITSKFVKEMSDGDSFEELLNTFPIKVTRRNGVIDYLRTDRAQSKKLYGMILAGNPTLHEHVIRCLRYEIDLRTKEGSMGYMKRLPNWLVSREWKSFEDRVVDSMNVQREEVAAYGTELE